MSFNFFQFFLFRRERRLQSVHPFHRRRRRGVGHPSPDDRRPATERRSVKDKSGSQLESASASFGLQSKTRNWKVKTLFSWKKFLLVGVSYLFESSNANFYKFSMWRWIELTFTCTHQHYNEFLVKKNHFHKGTWFELSTLIIFKFQIAEMIGHLRLL